MQIGKLEIGRHQSPVFLAELSGNHNGDLDRALAVIDAMADAGAHAIKLQTYTADTMTIDVDRPDFTVGPESDLWAGHTLHELYEIAHTPWEWHQTLFQRAAARGMECLSTPFDVTAVDFLESLHAPAYKVASFESTDHALVRRIAKTGKPMIISTGMSSLAEIAETVEVARDAGCGELMLLKCTSAYPASPTDSQSRHHSPPARCLRLRGRPVRPHSRYRRPHRRRHAGCDTDREACHDSALRRRGGQRFLPRA